VTKKDMAELMKKSKSKGAKEIASLYGDPEGLVLALKSNSKTGLSGNAEDLVFRRTLFGRNYIPPPRSKWFIELVWEAFQDKILIVLIAAAIISIILGVTVDERPEVGWIDGAAILVAVIIVVMVTAVNDWNKERQFRDLQKRLDDDQHFSVLRNGEIREVSTADLVVGDIAQFKYGNTLPTDGVLLSGYDVKINESALTGESALVKKSLEEDPMMLGGTQVMEGGGSMVVTAVGPNSRNGIIITLLSAKDEEEVGFITAGIRFVYRFFRKRCCPPKPSEDLEGIELKEEENAEADKGPSSGGSVLQNKLNRLAALIAYLATGAAVLTVVVLVIRQLIEVFAVEMGHWENEHWNELVHYFIIGIIVLVVAIPEGLPLAVTIALAYSVKKMLTDNNLVRHLHACETMGNATTICSDKTGTLTTNRMTVVESYLASKHYQGPPATKDVPPGLLEILHKDIALNSSYSSKIEEEKESTSAASEGFLSKAKNRLMFWKRRDYQKTTTEDPGPATQGNIRSGRQPVQIGNVTECALLQFSMSLGEDPEQLRKEYPTSTFVKVFTFNSARKYMATVIRLPNNGGYRMLVKGASERILARCYKVHGADDCVSHMSASDIDNINRTVVSSMASNALRTIGLAYRDFPPMPEEEGIVSNLSVWENEEDVVNDLTLVGIVGIQDPVRPEVPGCIRQCQEAGITVRMVTGDNVDTARAIAVKCGILSTNDNLLVLDGEEFNKRIKKKGVVYQKKFDEVWPKLRVLARSSPTDKYTFVDHIIRSRINPNREVVAVTGDGTNDGPALKKADVGFAMGIAGTDVAKEACDIILTDDNFASIVKAVMWGRNVYDSVSKFLQFQLTVNVVAVLLTLIASVAIRETPLRALQLLWVNLIMDALASLALATERPTPALLKRAPYGRKKPLISYIMWRFILGHSAYQLIVTLVILFAGPVLFDIDSGIGRDFRARPSQHFTIIFNTFVFMQLFNEINARTVHNESNVFDRFFSNYVFIGVMFVQTLLQIIIAQFGDIVFNTSGLEAYQWFWCFFLAAGELIVHQLLILIPVDKLPDMPKIRCRRKKHGPSSIHGDEEEADGEALDSEDEDEQEQSKARVLWIRNITRIQRQLRVVRAFRASMVESRYVYISALHEFNKTPYSSHRPTISDERPSSTV
jgi:Ca2+ transporting ATPase